MPQSRLVAPPKLPLDITQERAELTRKLEILTEESLINPDEIAAMRADLAEIEANNDARNSGRTYESLDALSRQIELAEDNAKANAQKQLETLNMLSSTLDSLSGISSGEFSAEAQAQMSALLKKKAQENPEIAKMLAQVGDFPLKLDSKTMQQLADAMRDAAKAGEKRFAKWSEEGSTQFASGSIDEKELEAWLTQNAPDDCVLLAIGINGGNNRGRGDAELNFSGETTEFSGAVKDIALAHQRGPGNSAVLRSFAVAPTESKAEQGEVIAGTLRGGKAVSEQSEELIYPEHRSAVKRYFKAQKRTLE